MLDHTTHQGAARCPLQVGSSHKLIVHDLGHAGAGVARCAGWPVFIPGALPGDTVQITITEVQSKMARGRLDKVVAPAPARLAPPCPYFGACGGCQLQQWQYQAQLAWKQERVIQTLARIGGFTNLAVNPIIPAPQQWAYRNSAQFLISMIDGRPALGFAKSGSHDLVALNEGCRLMHPLISKAATLISARLDTLGPVYNERTGRGVLRHIVMRAGFARPQLLVTMVCAAPKLPGIAELAAHLQAELPALCGITINVNRHRTRTLGPQDITVWGRDYIEETLVVRSGVAAAQETDLTFRISARSFFQVNPAQAGNLFQVVAEYADPANAAIAVDAYCGTGSIALYLARCGAGKVWGIEEEGAAVADAKANADLNKIRNVAFYQGRVEDVAAKLVTAEGPPDVLVIDPPRAGCDPGFLHNVAAWQPRRFVYVSCNPATLARDLRLLNELDYTPCKVQPVDMFPHTAHVECVVLMTNCKPKG